MNRTPNRPDLVQHFIDELQRPAKPLTDWEENFLGSVSDYFSRRGKLTDAQFETLEKIYTKKTV